MAYQKFVVCMYKLTAWEAFLRKNKHSDVSCENLKYCMLKKLFRECLLSTNCPRRLLLLGGMVEYLYTLPAESSVCGRVERKETLDHY